MCIRDRVDAVNKIIKHHLKTKLDECKGVWPELLPEVLWAYRTTTRTSTGETPFSLAFGVDALVPVEIQVPLYRIEQYDPASNQEDLRLHLDLLEERRNTSQVRVAAYQQRIARYRNAKVRPRSFQLGDLVLRQKLGVPARSLDPNWEGPYRVIKIVRPGTYYLEDMQGKPVRRPWHVEHLLQYFP